MRRLHRPDTVIDLRERLAPYEVSRLGTSHGVSSAEVRGTDRHMTPRLREVLTIVLIVLAIIALAVFIIANTDVTVQ